MKSELGLGVLFTGKLDPSFDAAIKKIKDSLTTLSGATSKVTSAQNTQSSSLKNMQKGLTAYTKDVEKLIALQARWYGAKMVLFAAWDFPVQMLRRGLEFFVQVDTAEAKLRRYEAMMGEVGEATNKTAKEVVLLARQLNLEYATPFEDIILSADRLRAAGVPLKDIMQGTLEAFVQFHTAWPEVEMDKFTKAVVGMQNTFKSMPGMKELINDTERYKAILDKVTVAMGVGVMEPKDLPLVLQHFGQMAQTIALSVDEMMALSVLVTNLGKKAGPAARALRGLSVGLVQEDKIKLLKQLGIELDRNIPLGKQFLSVIDQLQKKVTGTGEKGMSVGAQTILGKLVSTERIDPLVAFIRDMQMYNDYLEMIKNSQGANERAAAEMNKQLAAQWKMFVELTKEIGKVAFGIDEMSGALTGLTEIMKVFALVLVHVSTVLHWVSLWLAAIPATAIAAYNALKKMATLDFSGAKEEMSSLRKWFEIEEDKIVKNHNETIDFLYRKRGSATSEAEFEAAGREMRKSSLARKYGKEYKMKDSRILAQLKNLGIEEDEFLTPDELVKNKKIGPALIASERSIANARLEMQKSTGKLVMDLLENSYKLRTIQDEEYWARRLANIDQSVKLEKKILENEWAVLSAQYDEDIEAAVGNEVIKIKKAKEADKIKIEAKKKDIDNRAALEKNNIATQMELKNIEFTKTGIEHIYAMKEAWREEEAKKEEQALKMSGASLEEKASHEKSILQEAFDNYKEKNEELQKVRGITAEQQLALENELQLKTLKNASDIASVNRKLELEYIQTWEEGIQHSYTVLSTFNEQVYDSEKDAIDKRRSLNENLYSRNLIKAKEYYENEISLIRQAEIAEKNRLDRKREADKKSITDRLAMPGTPEQKAALNNQLLEIDQKYQGDVINLSRETTNALNEIWWKYAYDMEVIFSNEGILGVVRESLLAIIREYEKYGSRLQSMTDSIVKGMANSFETLFVDIMKLEFKSLGDYIDSFLGNIRSAFARFLADQVTLEILNIFKKVIPSLFNSSIGTQGSFPDTVGTTYANVAHRGGMVGTLMSGRNVPDYLFANAPRLHSGLMSDEYPAILQRGESVIPKGGTPNVQVNIDNRTGAEVEATPKIDFDMDRMVVGIVLKNVGQNGALRNLFKR